MPSMPSDNLNDIGVLKRREIEARLLAPLVQALGDKFGREEVIKVVGDTIVRLAREQGAEMARQRGDASLGQFADTLEDWKRGDALEIEVLEQTPRKFAFNVTRCRYAELYRSLGIPELGAVLSCNRDFSLIEGFNPEVRLERTQTLMNGATHCDFRYELQGGKPDSPEKP